MQKKNNKNHTATARSDLVKIPYLSENLSDMTPSSYADTAYSSKDGLAWAESICILINSGDTMIA